jgi:hypothetical protein
VSQYGTSFAQGEVTRKRLWKGRYSAERMHEPGVHEEMEGQT